MKALVLHGNEDLRYEEYPTPELKAGYVKVRVKAAGICGSDIPRVLHNGAHFFPIVLGHEFSGVVDQVGEGVTSVQIGDHVSGAPLVPCMKCADCQKGNYALCRHYSFIGSRQQGSFAEDGTPYILDWSHATQGNASADAARTYLLFWLNGDIEGAKQYLDLFCQKSNTAKQYVQKWMPIVAASQSVKGNEKEREFLLSWVDVVDYE